MKRSRRKHGRNDEFQDSVWMLINDQLYVQNIVRAGLTIDCCTAIGVRCSRGRPRQERSLLLRSIGNCFPVQSPHTIQLVLAATEDILLNSGAIVS